MDFGKLDDISNIDFRLPPDAPSTRLVLGRNAATTEKPTLYIGPTGWAMPQWIGKTYPKNAKTKDFLVHYSKQFNTIELNTTHYRIPDIALLHKWYAETPADFRFCPKVPQTISHARDLGLTSQDLVLFLNNIVHLREKLGCCFLQVPPHFNHKSLGLLKRFLETWITSKIPLAIEVRHEDFFNFSTSYATSFFEILDDYGVGTVITDVSGRRDVLHQCLTNNVAMIRFVGNGLHITDYQRVDEWITRLQSWYDAGLKTCYFFTHEPDNLVSPELADYVAQCATKYLGVDFRGPTFFTETDANQGQMSLF